jgi:hypothetical protein
MEATGLAHGPVVAKKEGNASGAKGPWAVAHARRLLNMKPSVRCGWQAQRLRYAKILALRSHPRNKPN